VAVSVNAVQRVDAHMSLAQATQSVTVTTESAVLETDRADVHTDLNATQVQSLPAISSEGKSFQGLYRIIPGSGLPMESNSAGGNPQRAMTSNINGQSTQGNDTPLMASPTRIPGCPTLLPTFPPPMRSRR
jgi:hypothetical protein